MARIRIPNLGGPGFQNVPRPRPGRGTFYQADTAADQVLAGASTLLSRAAAEERRVALEAEQERKREESELRGIRTLEAFNWASRDADELVDTLTTQLDRGEVTREQLPDSFTTEFGKIKTKRFEGLDAGQQERIDAQLVRTEGRALDLLRSAADRHRRQEVASRTGSALEAAERQALHDPDTAEVRVQLIYDQVGADVYGADKVAALRQSSRERVWALYYDNQLKLGSRSPVAMLEIAADIQANEVLDPQKKTALLAQAQGLLTKSYAEAASDLEIDVRRGVASYGQIEQAYKSGIITPAKRTELTVHLDTEARKAAETALKQSAALGRVQQALDGRGFLDFRAKDDRDAVDLHFSAVFAPSLDARRTGDLAYDTQLASTMIADYAARVGIVPSAVRTQIRGAFRSGAAAPTPATLVATATAADLLDRLKTANPAIVDDFAEEDIRLGNTITAHVRAGVQALEAVTLARQSLAVPAAERDARRERYTAEKMEEKNRKRLERDYAKGFELFGTSQPRALPDLMVGEFERLVREEFTRSGELEAAQATALDHLRRVWGVTRTNSDGERRWMKYAPEAVYRVPGEDGSWIREQFLAEAKRGSIFGASVDLTIAADSITAREAAREAPPSYVVLLKRNGVFEPMLGTDGKPMRFRPDYASSPASARRRKALEAEQAEAMKTLEEEISRRAAAAQGGPTPTVLAP
jgi:hypothetical protein